MEKICDRCGQPFTGMCDCFGRDMMAKFRWEHMSRIQTPPLDSAEHIMENIKIMLQHNPDHEVEVDYEKQRAGSTMRFSVDGKGYWLEVEPENG